MEGFKIVGGLLLSMVFVVLVAAYHAKRKLPEGETRNSIQGVGNSSVMLAVAMVPVGAGLLLIAGKSGWL